MTDGRTYGKTIENRFDHIQKELEKVKAAKATILIREKELNNELKKEDYKKYLTSKNPV